MGNKLGVFVTGGLVGAVIALVYGPRINEETHSMLSDKEHAVWAKVGEFRSQLTEDSPKIRQGLVDAAQRFCNRADTGVQQAADNIKPAFSQENDELRDKIEAARQRIATQIVQNATDDKAAIDGVSDKAAAQDATQDAAGQASM